MHRPGIRERFNLDGFKRRDSHVSQLDVRIHKTHKTSFRRIFQ
jgi:hypothetical protein